MKRILVCGGRDFGNTLEERKYIFKELDAHAEKYSSEDFLPTDFTLICGMAPGVDMVAYDWAITNWVPIEEYPANWDKHKKRAGIIRNKLMLTEGEPTVVIAFRGGEGTKNMVRIATRAGLPVIIPNKM